MKKLAIAAALVFAFAGMATAHELESTLQDYTAVVLRIPWISDDPVVDIQVCFAGNWNEPYSPGFDLNGQKCVCDDNGCVWE